MMHTGCSICFLEGDMSRSGGTERMTSWLANALCSEHSISILSLRLENDKVFFPLKESITHHVLPCYSGKLGIIKQIQWIRKYILDNHIDWVINVDVGMGFYGIVAAKDTAAKTVTWEHGNFYNNWGSQLFPYMRRYAARYSNFMVVLTERDRENYQTNISRCAPLHVIPNPAQTRSANYDTESKVILSVGHLLENKGYHRAVAVAAKLLPDRPQWKWIICGEGPERPRLEAMIREAGLEKQILLPGLVRDMDVMYRKAAVLVMTSEMEGLPMVLLEGKAHALPLVAFDIMTGPSDIITDHVNGFLVEPFNLEDLEQTLQLLLEDKDLRNRMSKNAGIGMEKFSEDTILKAWKNLLEG